MSTIRSTTESLRALFLDMFCLTISKNLEYFGGFADRFQLLVTVKKTVTYILNTDGEGLT